MDFNEMIENARSTVDVKAALIMAGIAFAVGVIIVIYRHRKQGK